MLKNNRLLFAEQDGYFFVFKTKVMIAHSMITKVNKASHVTISTIPFPKLGTDGITVLSAAVLSISFCQCATSLSIILLVVLSDILVFLRSDLLVK